MPRTPQFEDQQIIDALEKTRGNVTEAGKLLHVTRQTVGQYLSKMKAKGIVPVREKSPATMTRDELAKRNRERKVELASDKPRPPTLEEINSFLIQMARDAQEKRKLENQLAIEQTQRAEEASALRKRIEYLEARVKALEKHEQSAREFELAMQNKE